MCSFFYQNDKFFSIAVAKELFFEDVLMKKSKQIGFFIKACGIREKNK